MRNRIRSWLEAFRESLLFVPATMIVGSIVVAAVAIRIDDTATVDLPFVIQSSASSARTVLATVAGATVTVAGIVFAMTAVTVQLASSSYSPRVIRGFQRDRFQQTVIGAAAGTFTYCLVVLAAVRVPDADAAESIPEGSVAVTLGVVFGVGTIVAIVAYIDHVVRRMRSDEVIRGIATDTLESIRTTLDGDEAPQPLPDRGLPEGEAHEVVAPRTGWVRTIDADAILRRLPASTTARLDVTVGSSATNGFSIGRVWVPEGTAADEAESAIVGGIDIGDTRSMDQDPLFGLTLMTDVALRALSPGLNDPTTAVTVVEYLREPLFELLTRPQRPMVRRGDDARLLFEPERVGAGDYIAASIGEIRRNAAGQLLVLTSLLRVVGDLIETLDAVDDATGREALDHEAAALLVLADALEEPERSRLRADAARWGLKVESPSEG